MTPRRRATAGSSKELASSWSVTILGCPSPCPQALTALFGRPDLARSPLSSCLLSLPPLPSEPQGQQSSGGVPRLYPWVCPALGFPLDTCEPLVTLQGLSEPPGLWGYFLCPAKGRYSVRGPGEAEAHHRASRFSIHYSPAWEDGCDVSDRWVLSPASCWKVQDPSTQLGL